MFKKLVFCVAAVAALGNVSHVMAMKESLQAPKQPAPIEFDLKTSWSMHNGAAGALTAFLIQPTIENASPKERLQSILAGGLLGGSLEFLRYSIASCCNAPTNYYLQLARNYTQAILASAPAALVAAYMVGAKNFPFLGK
jgi:hypothetical protein